MHLSVGLPKVLGAAESYLGNRDLPCLVLTLLWSLCLSESIVVFALHRLFHDDGLFASSFSCPFDAELWDGS